MFISTGGARPLNSDSIINSAVIGVGAFGRNHARVYHELAKQGEPVRLVGVVDSNLDRADAVARDFGCRAFGSLDQLLTTHSEVQAASVAVPTAQHLPVARILMEAGVDLLIEKPVAASLAEADELIRLSQNLGRIVQVGHLERFNPAVRATFPLITQPMFFEVHRLSVFTPRSLDIDVVLDLMIHDLDIVLSFVNSSVKEIRAVGIPILSGKVDIANVRVERLKQKSNRSGASAVRHDEQNALATISCLRTGRNDDFGDLSSRKPMMRRRSFPDGRALHLPRFRW